MIDPSKLTVMELSVLNTNTFFRSIIFANRSGSIQFLSILNLWKIFHGYRNQITAKRTHMKPTAKRRLLQTPG
jgi:hypothetical protein